MSSKAARVFNTPWIVASHASHCYDGGSEHCEERMKFTGFLLLVSGAMIVLAAVALLTGAARLAFLAAGVAIEIGGLIATALAHRSRGGAAL